MRRFLIPRTCGTYSHTCVPALDFPTEVSAQRQVEAESLVLEDVETLLPIPAQRPVDADSMIHEAADTPTPALADSFEILLPQSTTTTPLVPTELEDDVTKVQSGLETKKSYQIKSPLESVVSNLEELSASISERVHFFSGQLKDLVIDSQTISEIEKRMRELETDAFKWFSVGACSLVGFAMGRYRSRLTRYVYGGTGGVAMATICFPDHAHHYNQRGVEFCQRGVLYGMDLWGNGPQSTLRDGDLGAPISPYPKRSKVNDLTTEANDNLESLIKKNYFKEPFYNPKHDEKINNVESTEDQDEREKHNSEVLEDVYDTPTDSSSENGKDIPSKNDQETPRIHFFPEFVPYRPAIPRPPKNHWDHDEGTINIKKLQLREEHEPDFPQTDDDFPLKESKVSSDLKMEEGYQYTNNSPNINIDLCIQNRFEEYYNSCKNEEKEESSLNHNTDNEN